MHAMAVRPSGGFHIIISEKGGRRMACHDLQLDLCLLGLKVPTVRFKCLRTGGTIAVLSFELVRFPGGSRCTAQAIVVDKQWRCLQCGIRCWGRSDTIIQIFRGNLAGRSIWLSPWRFASPATGCAVVAQGS